MLSRTITKLYELRNYIKHIKRAKFVSVDTETTGLDTINSRIVGIALSIEAWEGVYIPIRHENLKQLPVKTVLTMLKPILEDPTIIKAAHNLKFDYQMFLNDRITLKGALYDTQIMAYLVAPNEHQSGLGYVSEYYLGHSKDPIKTIIGSGKKMIPVEQVDIDIVAPYAANDAALVSELVPILKEKLIVLSMMSLYMKIELPLIFILADMERVGITVDSSQLKELSQTCEHEINSLSKQIYTAAEGRPFLISSPKQLSKLLFNDLKLIPPKKTKTGLCSTDSDVLEELKDKHPIISLLIKYRHLSKIKSTYLDTLPEIVNKRTGRVHTSLHQTVAATGRLASSKPNLQNIPIRDELGKSIRRAFIAKKGHVLLVADYSQIELRILAHLSGDQTMINTFKSGGDIHKDVADSVFAKLKDRQDARFKAKIVNFSINYGTSVKSLARELGTSTKEAQIFLQRYFWKYPRIRDYQHEIVMETETQSYSITIMGRKRPVPELQNEKPAIRHFGERVALNNPIQGSAADVVKIAMIQTTWALKKAKLKTELLLQVHDELIFEVPQNEVDRAKEIIKACMEDTSAYLKNKLTVPIPVNIGIGQNWTDAKE